MSAADAARDNLELALRRELPACSDRRIRALLSIADTYALALAAEDIALGPSRLAVAADEYSGGKR